MSLQESGISHSLTEFERGRDAAEVLCAESGDAPVPDAILLDLNTPCTNGFEVLHKLRDCPRLARVPIAILTSSRAQSDKHRAALQGARYIEKPSELDAFLSSVANAVKEMLRGSYASAY